MFDDSKRLDALEAWRKDVNTWQLGTTKAIETANKYSNDFDKDCNKQFDALNKHYEAINKAVEQINRNFADIWKRLDALEAKVKKAKL